MDSTAFCGTCPYMERDPQNLQTGVCHANPPTGQAISPNQTIGIFPPVSLTQTWCARHPKRDPKYVDIEMP